MPAAFVSYLATIQPKEIFLGGKIDVLEKNATFLVAVVLSNETELGSLCVAIVLEHCFRV